MSGQHKSEFAQSLGHSSSGSSLVHGTMVAKISFLALSLVLCLAAALPANKTRFEQEESNNEANVPEWKG